MQSAEGHFDISAARVAGYKRYSDFISLVYLHAEI